MSSFKKYLLWKLKTSSLRTVLFTVLAVMLILPMVSAAVDYTHSDISYSSCGISNLDKTNAFDTSHIAASVRESRFVNSLKRP